MGENVAIRGAGIDTFTFANTRTVGGTIDGGTGVDIIDWTAYTTARSVTISTLDANGADGDETSITTGSFTDIETVISAGVTGTSGDSLSGPNAVATWAVTTSDDGTQRVSPVFTGVSVWHAGLVGSGAPERGPSSGCKNEGSRRVLGCRGPPERG